MTRTADESTPATLGRFTAFRPDPRGGKLTRLCSAAEVGNLIWSRTVKAPWITYRPEIKVLDCTIRDGGLINNHQFEDGFVRAVYETCLAAGVDYMEI